MSAAFATFYCACSLCCTTPDRLTAGGTVPVPNHTVAAPRHIPFGTRVRITLDNGHVYTLHVEDRLGRHCRHRNHWDIFVGSHAEAVKAGVHMIRKLEVLPPHDLP